MPDLTSAKPGDNLILVHASPHLADENVRVTRVGRVYLYVAHGDRELRRKYDRETGYEMSDVTAVSSIVYTPGQFAEKQERADLRDALAKRGVRIDSEVSVFKARALLAVMESAEG
jgi:hypothetical protein